MATRPLFLVCYALLASSFAQQSTQDNFKLEGVVVNGLTGKPVPRALVVLSGTRALLTGPQGEFSFAGLSSGHSQIAVTKPGFFAPGARNRGWSPPINVVIGPEVTAMVVKLIPEAMILGRVTGKDEEPLEGATVQALTFMNVNGRQQLVPTPGNVNTDEDGYFRLAGLPSGKYFVAVKAGRVSRRILGAQSTNNNEGYQALVYYPGTTDFAAAAPFELSPGQRVETDFSLAPVPMFKVAGNVTVSGDWKQVHPPMIVDRSEQPLLNADDFDTASGAFTFKAVPAGTYSVRTGGMDQEGHVVTAHHTLNVAGPVTGLKLSLTPGINIPVLVRSELSKERPKGVCTQSGPDGVMHQSDCSDYPAARVELIPDDQSHARFYTEYGPLKDAQSYALHAVTPGRYVVRAHAMFGGYVQSVRSGGVDLMREPLIVPEGAEAPPIEVTIRDDAAILKVFVRRDKPGQVATIVVFSENRLSPEPRVIAQSGNAEIQSGPVPPGSYKVFAFDSINPLDYANPEFMEKYASRAGSVTLSAGGTASVTVDLIHTGE